MKDQYFGDVNDFRKYALLRALTIADNLSLGVVWMLTPPDGRTDGNVLSYLDQPGRYRHLDPDLFDFLHDAVRVRDDRRTAAIESSPLLGRARFQSEILADAAPARGGYFSHVPALCAGCDLVFFDPDNGLEVPSIPRGRKSSSKYLYWPEVQTAFAAGSSVLIYQHFTREIRDRFIPRLADQLRAQTGAAAVFSFRTPHVLFLLAAHDRHAGLFRRRLPIIEATWTPQIISLEHPDLCQGEERSGRRDGTAPSSTLDASGAASEPRRQSATGCSGPRPDSSTAATVQPPLVFRASPHLYGVLAAFATVLIGLGVLVGLRRSDWAGAAVAGLLTAMFYGVLVYLRFEIDPSGIIERTPVRTRRIPFDDITGAGFETQWGSHAPQGAAFFGVRLADGRSVTLNLRCFNIRAAAALFAEFDRRGILIDEPMTWSERRLHARIRAAQAKFLPAEV